MAILNLEALRLTGINVTRDVVANLRNGSEAEGQTSTSCLSFSRHLTSYPTSDADTPTRYERPMQMAANTAIRAGRSGCFAGVLLGRSFAAVAKPVVSSRRPSFPRVLLPETCRAALAKPAPAPTVGKLSGQTHYQPVQRFAAGHQQWQWQIGKKAGEIRAMKRPYMGKPGSMTGGS